jgi:hypothetical protein
MQQTVPEIPFSEVMKTTVFGHFLIATKTHFSEEKAKRE